MPSTEKCPRIILAVDGTNFSGIDFAILICYGVKMRFEMEYRWMSNIMQ